MQYIKDIIIQSLLWGNLSGIHNITRKLNVRLFYGMKKENELSGSLESSILSINSYGFGCVSCVMI